MTRLLSFLGATAGGYAGWALGAPVGQLTGFVVSVVGTGVGMYWGRRIGRHYEGSGCA
jgi:phage tail tape-measure protein